MTSIPILYEPIELEINGERFEVTPTRWAPPGAITSIGGTRFAPPAVVTGLMAIDDRRRGCPTDSEGEE